MSKERKPILGLIVLMTLLGFIFTQTAFGFQNEPTGFHGNVWGTPVEGISFGLEKVESIEEINIDIYIPDIDIRLTKAKLLFLDGKLAVSTMKLNDPKYIELFLKLHIIAHGQPTATSGTYVMWEGQIADVQFDTAHGIVTMGSPTGMDSVEALLGCYQSRDGS